MAELSYNDRDKTGKNKLINKKAVEIILHHGEHDYLYREYTNGERVKVLLPTAKK